KKQKPDHFASSDPPSMGQRLVPADLHCGKLAPMAFTRCLTAHRSNRDLAFAGRNSNRLMPNIMMSHYPTQSSMAGTNQHRFSDAVMIVVPDAAEHGRVADASGDEDHVLALGHFRSGPHFAQIAQRTSVFPD